MAQNNATVQFYYVPINGTLPSDRDENTIYFDAEGKGLYVGTAQIAADNQAQDLNNYVTNSSLTATLENYALKNQPTFHYQIQIDRNNNAAIIAKVPTGFSFSIFDETEDTFIPAQLTGIATPTASTDAATKGYIDTAIANLPTPSGAATWIVS